MRLAAKSGFAMATILVASLGVAGLAQAAPLAGVAAAVPAVQMTQAPLVAEALPEKAYHRGYKHHRKPYVYRKPARHRYRHHYHHTM
ncbi:MAG: hypothetical protein ACRECN_00340 [Methylocella sp.]